MDKDEAIKAAIDELTCQGSLNHLKIKMFSKFPQTFFDLDFEHFHF